jgi:hypothetical protein
MIKAVHLLFASLILFAVACDSDDDSPLPQSTQPTITTTQTTPTPGETQTPLTPAPTPVTRPRPEANPLPEELQARALELLAQIGEVRGTPARRQIDMFLMSRDQARAFYLPDDQSASDEEPPGSSQPEPPEKPFNLRQETYVLLGLIPPPQPSPDDGGGEPPDLQEQEIDNLISQITGFYSNEFGALYLVDNSGNCVQQESTIVHELTHALQYQYRDIDALIRERSGDWDGTRALLQLIEGDAVYTENRVLGFSTRSTCVREPVCFQIPPARSATPYVIERELDTWYEDGVCFIAAVQDKLTRGIIGIFEDLPATTEQILHPEKYLEGEGAKEVFLNDLAGSLGPDWELKGQANLGEFGLQNLLLLGLQDTTQVQAAADGWGGDAFAFYGAKDGASLLHIVTRWDNRFEASEFLLGLADSLAGRGGEARESNLITRYRTTIGDVIWSAARTDDYVTVLISTDAGAVDAAATVVE